MQLAASSLNSDIRKPTVPEGSVGLQNMPRLQACTEIDPQRERVEQYISGIFHGTYNARILEFLPLLCSLKAGPEHLAALGLRSGASGPLFCEQYLDSSLEQEIQTLYGETVSRSETMELGNLVASQSGLGVLLYLVVAKAIEQAGVRYLIFAANRKVQASIARCGFAPRPICNADKTCLGEQAAYWGNYYEGGPVVMVADIPASMVHAESQPAMREILNHYCADINDLAEVVRA